MELYTFRIPVSFSTSKQTGESAPQADSSTRGYLSFWSECHCVKGIPPGPEKSRVCLPAAQWTIQYKHRL